MNLTDKLDNKELFIYFRRFAAARDFFSKKHNGKAAGKACGIYFGDELCEYRMPSLREIKSVYKMCVVRGKSFVLVTGPSSCALLNLHKKTFDFMDGLPRAEVVVNDWGILHMLAKNYPNIIPTLGRLLTKNKRFVYKTLPPDTEGLPEKETSAIAKNQLKALRETNITVKEYRDFLKKYSVEKIDIDIPPQGIVIDDPRGFDFGFYYPWGYLSGGRTCPHNPKGRFYVSSCGCPGKRCLQRNLSIKSKKLNTELLQSANSLLYKIDEKNIPAFTKRAIYQLDI